LNQAPKYPYFSSSPPSFSLRFRYYPRSGDAALSFSLSN
jgi:hypothetical protein